MNILGVFAIRKGGRRWTFAYDANNYLTTQTTPLGCQTGYTYSLAGSNVTLVQAITDPRGFVTSYQYDTSQRVTQMTAGSAVWSWTYGTAGPGHPVMVMTSPAGAVTTYHYDLGGKLATLDRPEGVTSTPTHIVDAASSAPMRRGIWFNDKMDWRSAPI